MKRMILLSVIAMLLSSPVKGEKIEKRELEDLVKIVLDNDLAIDEWKVTIKEKVTMSEAQEAINQIKTNDYFTRKESENSVIYSFEGSHIFMENVETYTVIVPKNKHEKIEIIAEFKGYTWNEKIKTNYNKWLHTMVNQVFSPSAREYTCLTTEFNDIIDDDYVLNDIMEKLKTKHNQTQSDKNKSSTLQKVFYGYTPLWNQKVDVMDDPLNVQIAVIKNELGMVKFIFGTPILINEY